MRKFVKNLFIIFASGLIFIFFQNCGSGFESPAEGVLSSACQEIIKKVTQPLGSPSCEAIDEYTCERRVFNSGVETGVEEQLECLSKDNCLNVKTRYYGTGNLENIEAYNRVEVICAHSHRVRDVAVYIGEASNLLEALDLAIASCEGNSQ